MQAYVDDCHSARGSSITTTAGQTRQNIQSIQRAASRQAKQEETLIGVSLATEDSSLVRALR